MSYRLLLVLGFCILISSERDENDKLLCHSCKGIDCEQITTNDENKIICNRKTQLCWAGFIDAKPYRTCASRYCTPSDFSLDSDIHIETCCRSNFCNSVSLSWSTLSLFHSTEAFTTEQVLINEEDENVSLPNTSDSKYLGVIISYDKDFSNRVASISSILLFLMPLLLVFIFN